MKIGVIGFGNYVRTKILAALVRIKFTGTLYIFTRYPEPDISNQYQFTIVFVRSISDILSSDVSHVYIGSSNDKHFHQAVACLQSHKHVLLEKPAVQDKDQANELVHLASSKNLKIIENFHYKYHPRFNFCKELIASKKYGELLSLSSKFGFNLSDTKNFRFSTDCLGGALNDAGVYPLSASLEMLGALDVVQGFEKRELNAVDTFGLVSLVNDYSIVAVIGYGFRCSYKCDLELWFENAYVSCDRFFTLPPDQDSIVNINENGFASDISFPAFDQLGAALKDFLYKNYTSERISEKASALRAQSYHLNKIKSYLRLSNV